MKLFQNFPWICKNWWSYLVDLHLRRVKVMFRFWFYLYGIFWSPLQRIENQGTSGQFWFQIVEVYQFYLKQTVCWRLENLFLTEFILRWPMIRFFGYVRRCLLNPIRSLFSVSEDSERKDSLELLLLRPICS